MNKNFAMVGIKSESRIAKHMCSTLGINAPVKTLYMPAWILYHTDSGKWMQLGSSPSMSALPVFVPNEDIESIVTSEVNG